MITSPIKRDKPTVGERVRMGMVPSHKPDSLNPVAQGSVYGDQRFAAEKPVAGGFMQGLRTASDKVPGAAYIKDIPDQISGAIEAAGGTPRSDNLTGYGAALGQTVRSAAGVPVAIGADVYDKAKSVVTSAPARRIAGEAGDFASQLATGKPMEKSPLGHPSQEPMDAPLQSAPSQKNPNQDRAIPGMGPLSATNPNVDQRFQDMQVGIRGVSQDQIRDVQSRGLQYGGSQDGLKAYPKSNQIPTFTNGRGITPQTIGEKVRGFQQGQNLVKTNAGILASRQPGQAVQYRRNGLNVEFAPGTSNQEIMAFTDSHRRETSPERMAQARAETAARAALLEDREYNGSLPSMPIMPTNKTNAAMADYNNAVNARAKLIADTDSAAATRRVDREIAKAANDTSRANNAANNAVSREQIAAGRPLDEARVASLAGENSRANDLYNRGNNVNIEQQRLASMISNKANPGDIALQRERIAAMTNTTPTDNYKEARITTDAEGNTSYPILYSGATGRDPQGNIIGGAGTPPPAGGFETPNAAAIAKMKANKDNPAYREAYLARFGALPE